MARIECYISDDLKEKIAREANSKSVSASKYVGQILERHFECDNNHEVFQKKVMATLCNIYSCVFDSESEKVNQKEVVSRMG